ncbi:MAG: CBS domain-containing protein [Candidatus Omnitrophica bacterium]|nr:CBS domain-containing protein [Candidatus Omnitrophota bacterium]MCA9426060.1 CBS domain-containing protein [Candidatus Omnitrophota bacterium]MCA9432540.1 CBS domain-containing protein [Candidatus Omnitrophota bacterium]MCA9434274.1 CBS domain-containing protein [Candidatus Omnitrophota bacterium]MCA9447415.1 CBS domain-containing protein [Candidatus Omnitrophota bacterium]
MELNRRLREELIRHLPLSEPIRIEETTPISTLIDLLADQNRGCVLVEKEGRLHGLVSERDILAKVLERKMSADEPVSAIMSTEIETLRPDESLDRAIQVMTSGGYRHVPLVDESNRILGLISARNVIDYISEHFPAEVFNLPPRLDQKMVSKEGA